MQVWWWLVISVQLGFGKSENYAGHELDNDYENNEENLIKKVNPHQIYEPDVLFKRKKRSTGEEREKKQPRFHSWGGKRYENIAEEKNNVLTPEVQNGLHEDLDQSHSHQSLNYSPNTEMSESNVNKLYIKRNPPAFSSWAGKRVPEVVSFEKKSNPFTIGSDYQNSKYNDNPLPSIIGTKRYPAFSSWGGKRSSIFHDIDGRGDIAFSRLGGKRGPAFSSWGGKRNVNEVSNQDNNIDFMGEDDRDMLYPIFPHDSDQNQNIISLSTDKAAQRPFNNSYLFQNDDKEINEYADQKGVPVFSNWNAKRGQTFSSWGGKRAPAFSSWGGKRAPAFSSRGGKRSQAFSSWGDKRVPAFSSWGGKRAAAFSSWGGKRPQGFSSWGGKRAPSFSSWGGKRVPSFSSWGGKRASRFSISSGKRSEPFSNRDGEIGVSFVNWGGKRNTAFTSTDDKRAPAFSSWGGKRNQQHLNSNDGGEDYSESEDEDVEGPLSLEPLMEEIVHSKWNNDLNKQNCDQSLKDLTSLFSQQCSNNLQDIEGTDTNVVPNDGNTDHLSLDTSEESINQQKDQVYEKEEIIQDPQTEFKYKRGEDDFIEVKQRYPAFSSWGGKRNSDTEKRAQPAFSSWGGKRSPLFSAWYGNKMPTLQLTSGKRRPAFSSWGGKRSLITETLLNDWPQLQINADSEAPIVRNKRELIRGNKIAKNTTSHVTISKKSNSQIKSNIHKSQTKQKRNIHCNSESGDSLELNNTISVPCVAKIVQRSQKKNTIFQRMLLKGNALKGFTWPVNIRSFPRGVDFYAWGGKRSLS